ncbi:MAG: UDP-N-acetylglucosamine--N-acetylmuramyl-(pentapeptide) pyrophosphoryl-undecaprenol N-acetylglucosamine transferase [Bacteroidia bacterium]|nr:MAG: UDP-N-acetylglucosamine--N-acetylmuramyl-(pentapeptide) pyrophosphoryl-undecaprenol N-acetylglucosamine transferase [Bacteroidia bacterium]
MSLVIAAGGTGGHVFPALAVASVWRAHWPQAPIYWVGVRGGREEKWVSTAGWPFYSVPVRGWQPKAFFRNLTLFYKLPRAMFFTHRLLSSLRPKVLFTTGGYPGLLPGIWGIVHKVPVVVLELNAHAGRTTRWLSRWASCVYGAFPHTQGLLPSVRYAWVGVPVRFRPSDKVRYSAEEAKKKLGFAPESPLILVLGGSQGSSALNQAVASCVSAWVEAGASLLWQVGGGRSDMALPAVVRQEPFIEDMVAAYTAADVVVSRAGGSTLGELAWWGKAAVLVPSPHVAEDHQRKNAAYWAQHNAALVVEETDNRALCEAVLSLLRREELRKQYGQAALQLARPDAAETLAQVLYQLAYDLS